MPNKTLQLSVLDRLGLNGVEATPFTLKWLERAINDDNCEILSSIIESHSITRLNLLTEEQKQVLNALPDNQFFDIDDSFKNAIMSLNPMHIAMTLIGYKLFCNECSTYIVNENALLLTTNDEESCPYCDKSNGVMDLFFEVNSHAC